MMAWFGFRGIGAIYHLMYAATLGCPSRWPNGS